MVIDLSLESLIPRKIKARPFANKNFLLPLGASSPGPFKREVSIVN